MTRVRVKGFQIFRDRHGKMRCYHRKTSTPIDLTAAPIGSAEFFAECARISEQTKLEGPPKPGTLGLLINEYRAAPAFADLAPRTRADYQRCFDYLKPIKDTPLVKFDAPLVVRIRDRAAQSRGRRFGTYVKAVLSLTFNWGIERGYLSANPAEGIKNIRRPKDAPRANRPWSDEERYAVIDAAPMHLRVPLGLGMYAALREGDALAVTKAHYDGETLEIRTRKTGRLVSLKVIVPLKEILDNAPKHDAITLAANSRGKPWTEDGFRASWRKFRIELENSGKIAKGLTFHGLRHTVATILREEGFGNRDIADVLGHESEAMARHYSRDADLRQKTPGVMVKFETAENRRRTKSVKPS